MQIDRRDNNKGYSPDNCRWVSESLNSVNRRVRSSNTSGYSGVSLNKKLNKWTVTITYKSMKHGRQLYLGCFKTAWEACQARNEFIKKHNLPHKIQERADEQ